MTTTQTWETRYEAMMGTDRGKPARKGRNSLTDMLFGGEAVSALIHGAAAFLRRGR